MAGQFLKRQLRQLLQGAGYDLRRIDGFWVPSLFDFLVSRQIDVVLDVGANVGQFGTSLRNAGYRGQIESFEPIPGVFEELCRNMRGDRRWKAHNVALGSAPGRKAINVSERSEFSSFLTQTSTGTRWGPETAVVRVEEVEVVTIDSVFGECDGRNVFLKIDTQGFERQVLEGARSAMERLRGIQLELPIVHLYHRTWSFCEAVEYMKRSGFVISQIRPAALCRGDRVSLAEIDCVFRQRDPEDDENSR